MYKSTGFNFEMGTFVKIVSVIVSIPILLMSLLLFSSMPYHNFVLKSFAHDLFSITISPEDILLEKRKEVGVLSGNGNHCDYYAGLLIKTTKNSKDRISKYYKQIYEGDSNIRILDVREYFSSSSSDEISIRSNRSILDSLEYTASDLDVGEFLYVVYIFEHSMTERVGDVRCT